MIFADEVFAGDRLGAAIGAAYRADRDFCTAPDVRYGSEAEVQQTRAGCLLLAISGHSLLRRVLLGALGPDSLGAGLQLFRIVVALGVA